MPFVRIAWHARNVKVAIKMGNAKTNEKRQELVEDEVALQRWSWEGGSPLDRFGVMDKIEAQLERHTATLRQSVAELRKPLAPQS